MTKAIPAGMHSITAALTLDKAAEAVAFYEKAFGAREEGRAADPSGTKIWHTSLKIGDSTLFLNDTFPEMGATANKTRLWFYMDGVDAAWKRALEAGCTVRMPLSDMFWGDRCGSLLDPWGNEWTLAQRIKDMTPDEMQRAQDEFVKSMKR